MTETGTDTLDTLDRHVEHCSDAHKVHLCNIELGGNATLQK